ncbi:MAG: hypothetical protein ACLVKJ_01350 [Acutalibacteraceae bacterium]
MITLIIGKKGSGKTKKLIDAANNAIENTNGNVVVIEKESHLTLDISHQARLVALEPYGIHGCTAFYGFVSGICAGNYDVKEIFIDSTLKAVDVQDLECFIKKLDKLVLLPRPRLHCLFPWMSLNPAGVKRYCNLSNSDRYIKAAAAAFTAAAFLYTV